MAIFEEPIMCKSVLLKQLEMFRKGKQWPWPKFGGSWPKKYNPLKNTPQLLGPVKANLLYIFCERREETQWLREGGEKARRGGGVLTKVWVRSMTAGHRL